MYCKVHCTLYRVTLTEGPTSRITLTEGTTFRITLAEGPTSRITLAEGPTSRIFAYIISTFLFNPVQSIIISYIL